MPQTTFWAIIPVDSSEVIKEKVGELAKEIDIDLSLVTLPISEGVPVLKRSTKEPVESETWLITARGNGYSLRDLQTRFKKMTYCGKGLDENGEEKRRPPR